ncbi:L-fucose/L-arabinose isomerase family protein [Aeromicrobium sp.]
MDKRPVLGLIVGNRGGFPQPPVADGRRTLLNRLEGMGIDVIALDETATRLGAVETWQDAQACARLFRDRAAEIDGVLISLPNFADEQGIADSIRLSGLQVPLLVHGFPDEVGRMGFDARRDSFCGKISVCNNLTQYGYPFSLTERHTLDPESTGFEDEIRRFVAVCRVARGMRGARLGVVGTRPNAFKTVRFSEKLLEASGVSISVIDLSDVLGRVERLPESDTRVARKLDEIKAYVTVGNAPEEPLLRMSRLSVVLGDWMEQHGLQGAAIQCWDSMQNNFGFSACTVMSMMTNNLLPAACEADATGLVAMYALQLAAAGPSTLADWNNNFGDDPDRCVFFHCGYWTKSFVPELEFGKHASPALHDSWGTLHGQASAGPITYARVTTDDRHGEVRAYVGEGRMTDDPLDTYGTRAVVEIPGLQRLLRHICRNGFEHHVAMNASLVGDAVEEAFATYLGWKVYRHEAASLAESDPR